MTTNAKDMSKQDFIQTLLGKNGFESFETLVTSLSPEARRIVIEAEADNAQEVESEVTLAICSSGVRNPVDVVLGLSRALAHATDAMYSILTLSKEEYVNQVSKMREDLIESGVDIDKICADLGLNVPEEIKEAAEGEALLDSIKEASDDPTGEKLLDILKRAVASKTAH